MFDRLWRKLGRAALGSCAAMLIVAGTTQTAQAEENVDLTAVKSLLQQQQQKIAELERLIAGMSSTDVTDETKQAKPGDDKAKIEKIVGDYIKAADKKKKEDDEKKKKEAEEAGYEVGKDLTFKTTFKDGFYAETADKAFKFNLRGRWHNDWGWAEADAPNPRLPLPPALPLPPNSPVHPTILDPTRDLDDGTIFRRGRLGMQATLYEVHDFVAEFEFSSGAVVWREVWMGVNQLPYVGTFKVGHFKEFFSLEQLTSSRYLTFIERSIIDGPVDDNLGYNTGFALTNTIGCDQLGTWGAGVFRHTGDQGQDAGDGDYNVTGRLTFLPMYEHNGRCLFHVGAAASYRQPAGTFVPGRNEPVQDTVQFRTRPYRIDPIAFISTGNLSVEHYSAIGLEAALVYGPLSLQAEYHRWSLDNVAFSNLGVRDFTDADFHGYYMYASYFLTGENRVYSKTSGTFGRVKPHENFWAVKTGDDCECQGTCYGKGAWEVAARFAYLDLADGRIGTPGEVGSIPGTGALKQYTLGVNWYWNPNMKVQWNYELFNIDKVSGPAPLFLPTLNDGSVQQFVMRFAWDF